MILTLAKASSHNIEFPGTYNYFSGHTKKISKNYKQDKITYTFNSQGYRCDEFENIKWNESILALGCSYTQGVGLDDKECWTYQLQEKLTMPVVNLAQHGTSIFYHLYNLEILHELNPKFVIVQIPDVHRFTVFPANIKKSTRSLGYFSVSHREAFFKFFKKKMYKDAMEQRRDFHFMEVWSEDDNHLQYVKFAVNYIKTLYKDRCFFFGIGTNCQEPYLIQMHAEVYDQARDLGHAGPESHKSWANQLSQAIF